MRPRPRWTSVVFRFLSKELSAQLLAMTVFLPAGLCRSFLTALPRAPEGSRFGCALGTDCGAGCGAWLRWLSRFHGISDTPVSSIAVFPVSDFRQTVFSTTLVSSSFRNDSMTFMSSISALSIRLLRLPTHHQLCSTQLLQGELTAVSRFKLRHEVLEVPLLQSPSWLVLQTSLHSEPCSALMSVRYFPCARDLSRNESTNLLSTRAALG